LALSGGPGDSGGDEGDATAAAARFSSRRFPGAAPFWSKREEEDDASTALPSGMAAAADPADSVSGWLLSDAASIGLGLLGLILLLLVRVFGEDPYASAAAGAPEAAADLALAAARQTRSDLLAVLACLTVLSNGVARLDVQSALAETVELEGVRVSAPLVAGGALERLGRVSCWFLETMLAATPASSAVLLVAAAAAASGIEPASAEASQWKVACAAGALPSPRLAELSVPPASPVLDRAASERSGKDETYLPNLQALPARTEFLGYLPANTQAVLAIPVVLEPATTAAAAVVVLGSNRARSFAPRDIVRCQALAARLGAVASVG
jgi:hypothetical protein